jgi:fatty acid desaturase
LWVRYNPAVYVLAVLVIGSRQRALRSLMHEASHYKLFRNRTANIWVGRLLVAFPLLCGLSGNLCAHCEHHRYLWDQNLDPKRRQYQALGLLRPRDPKQFRRRHILRPLMLAHVPYNIISALSWRDEKKDETVARFSFLLGMTVTVVAFGWTVPVALLWLIPYCTTYQVIRYWSDIADHAGLESDDPWQATRSWDASWLIRALIAPHKANLHLAHHIFATVPHYRTVKMDKILHEVPAYDAGHHCAGFFYPSRPDRPPVLQGVLYPNNINLYHSGQLTNELGMLAQTWLALGRRHAGGRGVDTRFGNAKSTNRRRCGKELNVGRVPCSLDAQHVCTLRETARDA